MSRVLPSTPPAMTCVFHSGALGDSVLIWPLLRALAPATLIAPRGKARLAADRLRGVRAVDGDAPEFSRLYGPEAGDDAAGRVRALVGGADRIISFLSDGRDAWAANLAALAPRARRYFVRPRPRPDDPPTSIIGYQAGQLAEQGLVLRPIPAARRENPGGPVVLHPGSGGAEKRWPADRFDRVADHFQRRGRRVILILGEVERELVDARRLTRWRRRYETHEPGDPAALAEWIEKAAWFIGNDSGPTHLAGQLGVPALALFGPTDPRIWSPAGPGVHVLHPPQPEPMTWLSVERVLAAAG